MKRVLRIVAAGTLLGFILVMIRSVFQIDKDEFLRGCWMTAPAVVLGAAAVNVLYNVTYQRKMRGIAALLEAGKPEEYIAEMEKLLQTARGRNLRNVLKLNLAAGYMDIKQYDTAVSMLEELSGKRLLGSAVKMVHRLNLSMSYFYTAQYEKAMELYNGSRRVFEPYRNSKAYGGHIAAVDILAAIENGRYEEAKGLLDMARKSWSSPRLQDAFAMLDASLAKRAAADAGPRPAKQ